MRRAYLIIYDAGVGDREKVRGLLNAMRTIEKWRYELPNTFYIVSQYSAQEIADELRASTNVSGKFIVTEIPENSYGWLTSESWYFIQNLEYKPK